MNRSAILILAALAVAGCSESDDADASPDSRPNDGASQDQTQELPNQTPPEASTPPEVAVDPDRADRGRILFAVSPGMCVKCHGQDGAGLPNRAPNLTDAEFIHADGSLESIAQVIIEGVPRDRLSSDSYNFEMNARGSSNLTDQQCMDLAHYVRSLSQ